MLLPLAVIAAILPLQAEAIGRLNHLAIAEASGIVASRRHPGIFWVHNDSGNPPALFAVRKDGSLVREFGVGVPNVDWEDIAIDSDGHLFLGDIGNNGERLPLRAVYRIDEPDPSREIEGPLPATLASYYGFAKGDKFDAEGLFLDGKDAILVVKSSNGKDAELRAIPLDPPAPWFRPQKARHAGRLPGFSQPATGADLSADGSLLAVCSLREVRVYKRTGGGWSPAGRADGPDGQVEAVCWDGLDLILASEERGLARIAEATWRGRQPKSGDRR